MENIQIEDYYKEFLNDYFVCDIDNISFPDMIYHYTSAKALFSILEKKSIWFTDYNFLNDMTEFVYSDDILKQFSVYINESNLLPLVEQNIVNRKKVKLNNIDRFYMFSTSLKSDSLPMWNYYIKNNKYEGYCIGLSIKELIKNLKDLGFEFQIFIGTINYDINKQKKKILDLFSKINTKINKDQNFKMYFDEIINIARLFFKHPCFENEEEYRILIKLKSNLTNNYEDYYINNNGVFVPYLNVKLKNLEYIIKEIRLAPLLEKEISLEGLKRFLLKNGYTVDINNMAINNKLISVSSKINGIKIETSSCPVRY